MACAARFFPIKFTLGCFAGYICILLRLTHLVGCTSASLGCKASAACLGWCLRLHTLDLNVLSSATVALIVRTVYNITIQFCHHIYLLILSDFCRFLMTADIIHRFFHMDSELICVICSKLFLIYWNVLKRFDSWKKFPMIQKNIRSLTAPDVFQLQILHFDLKSVFPITGRCTCR